MAADSYSDGKTLTFVCQKKAGTRNGSGFFLEL